MSVPCNKAFANLDVSNAAVEKPWVRDICYCNYRWNYYQPFFLASSINRNWWRGQTRNSGKALAGLLHQGVITSSRFPCLLPEGDGKWAGSLYSVREGVWPGFGLEEWLRWFAHLFGGGVCKLHVQYPAFAPGSSEVAAGFGVFLYLFVHNLLQLCMHALFVVLNNFFVFYYLRLLSGCKHCSKGSQVSACLKIIWCLGFAFNNQHTCK